MNDVNILAQQGKLENLLAQGNVADGGVVDIVGADEHMPRLQHEVRHGHRAAGHDCVGIAGAADGDALGGEGGFNRAPQLVAENGQARVYLCFVGDKVLQHRLGGEHRGGMAGVGAAGHLHFAAVLAHSRS